MSAANLYLRFALCFTCLISAGAGGPKHIVFIVADDLGWNDVGFHNPGMITPNIDRLASQGVILNQSYVQPLCSPSRSALMSGYYPFKTGLQELKKLGFATHMVGKWHIGFCSWNCTPTFRGFDSFYGYYNAQEDYYTHATAGFLDYRDNKQPEKSQNGTYSTFRFTKEAENIINNHNASQPLFLYLPFQAVHAPLEVPAKYEALYPNITHAGRRTFCGMVSSLDEAIGNITKALEGRGLMNDTLIVFTADNGGWVTESGNNYPLRGGKFTVYEGGTRAVGFLHGAGLEHPGSVFNGMFHIVDWLPTLTAAVGGHPITTRDGMNLWPDISQGRASSARKELVYNYDDHVFPEEGHAAIRVGDYKLVSGYPGLYPNWYKPDQVYDNEALYYNPDVRKDKYQLFNLKDDPTEHVNLAAQKPEVVNQLLSRLEWYMKQAVPPNYPELPDPKSNPELHGNVWSPGWCPMTKSY